MRKTVIKFFLGLFIPALFCACNPQLRPTSPESHLPHPAISKIITNFPKWERIKQQEKLFASFEGSIAHGADTEKAAQWAALYEQCLNTDILTKLNLVNLFFNQWPYLEDIENWGVEDFWALPHEFMERSGDCEDFAIAKYYALKALNVPTEDMCLAVVWNTKRMEGHMVLLVKAGPTHYVLDNFRDELLTRTRTPYYVPLFYINEIFIWLDPDIKQNRSLSNTAF